MSVPIASTNAQLDQQNGLISASTSVNNTLYLQCIRYPQKPFPDPGWGCYLSSSANGYLAALTFVPTQQ